MKDRQKKMLRFMLLTKEWVRIDNLAKTFSIGRRTVSRDLDVLESWLSFRGARLERIPNQGTRVLTFGSSTDELLEKLNAPDAYFESLSPEVRQKLILLYLLLNNRRIKIASIANAFFVSDTTVWSDLNTIESHLDSSLCVERLRGVGIRLTGEESRIRLRFLSTMTEVFSSHTIIPYLYSLREDKGSFLEINQLRILLKRLNFPENNSTIFQVITSAYAELGYQFTMSGEALLYFYLQLAVHRIKSGALIEKSDFTSCIDYFYDLGKSMLMKVTDKIFSGKLPLCEQRFLGLILQVLEVGDLTHLKPNILDELITHKLKQFTVDIIDKFGKLDCRQYYLNSYMELVFSASIAALVCRLQNGIPFWHGEWGNPSSESWNRGKKSAVIAQLLESEFNLIANKRDLDYLLLYFQSMIFSSEDLPVKKVRCLVCCFEGIGLASYLQSLLRREIGGIDIVEATAVFKVRQDYLDAHGIELVISTFPISDLDTPVIPISLPLNKEKLLRDISTVVDGVMQKTSLPENPSENRERAPEEVFSFNAVMKFIQDFRIINLPDDDDIGKTITRLSRELSLDAYKPLSLAFQARENSGPLYFEEWGMRVLHCKSSIIKDPKAGVIELNGGRRILYMAAPDPCADQIRKMLSTITISFMDNSSFRDSIMSGGINLIRKNLMGVYKDFL